MNNSNEKEIVLAQWQTCVDMANSVSQRRDTANNLFVTLNMALITAISYMWEIKSIVLTISGIVTCFVWIIFINNFKHLNAAKFDVILNLESKLPFQVFSDEWEHIKINKKYFEATKLEKIFPIIFIFIYLSITIIILMTICN